MTQTFGCLLERWVRKASAQGNLGLLPTIGVAADLYLRGLVSQQQGGDMTYRISSPLWPTGGAAYVVTLGPKCPDDQCTGELCGHKRAMEKNLCSHILAARMYQALGAPGGAETSMTGKQEPKPHGTRRKVHYENDMS